MHSWYLSTLDERTLFIRSNNTNNTNLVKLSHYQTNSECYCYNFGSTPTFDDLISRGKQVLVVDMTKSGIGKQYKLIKAQILRRENVSYEHNPAILIAQLRCKHGTPYFVRYFGFIYTHFELDRSRNMLGSSRYTNDDFAKAHKTLLKLRRRPTLAIQESFERQFINMKWMGCVFIGLAGKCQTKKTTELRGSIHWDRQCQSENLTLIV